jgi:hypothetical protein
MQCILYKIYFLESFSYKLQLDMHSYLHKNFILAKSGCYIIPTSRHSNTQEELESWFSVRVHKILVELPHSTDLGLKKHQ